MPNYATKQDILDKFGIQNISQLTSLENIKELFSMIPKMNTELAKEIIDQVPDFSGKVRDILGGYENSVSEIVKANENTQEKYIDGCIAAIEALKTISLNDEVSLENKMIIVDKICDIEQDMKIVTNSNIKFNSEVAVMVGFCVVGAVGMIIKMLGVDINFTKK